MSSPRLLILSGAGSAALYACLALAGLPGSRPSFWLAIHGALFLLYLAAVLIVLRRPGAPAGAAALIGAGVVFRLILLPVTPGLSDDIYRYVWEGGLQIQGVNPYGHAPADPELIPLRDRFYEGINNKELPAIYPPVMQWAFALGTIAGKSLTAMKAVFVAADIGLMLALARLLRARGHHAARIVLYAWNPLIVVEVAGSGHNDPLAVLFLMVSTLGIIGQRPLLSTTALALSALSKLYPIVLLPLYVRRVRPWMLAVPPVAMVVCYLPYAAAGDGLFHSVRAYAERWRSNDSVFTLLVAFWEASGFPPIAKGWADARGLNSLYTQPHMLARGTAAIAALAVMAILLWRRRGEALPLERAIYLFTGAVLILAPTMHPWYLIWIVPWLALYPSAAWLWLTATSPLSYLAGAWSWWVEYPPFFLLLLLAWWRGRGAAAARQPL